jgi:prepilin-type N-terminal cleavage/methylation domain-containing protein
MPTSASAPKPPGLPRQLPRGFTLIEMLVVLALIALVAALALPRLGSPPRLTGQEQLRSAIAILAEGRQAAVASGRAQALDPAVLGPNARYAAAIGPSDRILFYADGSSSGGTLTLAPGRSVSLSLTDGRAAPSDDGSAQP